MNLFQRISATFSHSVDQAVCRIENHDALIEASLKKARQQAGKARASLASIQRGRTSLETRLESLQAQKQKWHDRAQQLAATERDKALSCLEHYNRCCEDIETTSNNLLEQHQREQDLQATLNEVEQRLQQMEQQRHQLRTRQFAAEAGQGIDMLNANNGTYLDDVFERWEAQVIATEYPQQKSSVKNQLDLELSQAEQKQALNAQLDALLDGPSTNTDNTSTQNKASD